MFPSSLPNIDTATSSDTLQAAGHTELHNDKKDNIDGIAAKLGIDGSTDTTTHDYRLNAVESEHDADNGKHTTISSDTINESTTGNGVAIDGLSVKDGKLNTADSVGADNLIDYEKGSNTNGTYIKYPNGDLICWKKRLTLTYNTTSECMGRWTFPLAFVDAEYAVTCSIIAPTDSQSPDGFAADASPNTEQIAGLGMGVVTADSVDFSVHRMAGQTDFASGDKMYINVVAHGKWK